MYAHERKLAKKVQNMVRVFRTLDDGVHQINEIQEGCWVSLTSPSPTELKEISEKYSIEIDHLQAALDEEERSRIEVEDHYTMIIVDIPITEERKGKDYYVTIPCGIIITEELIFTICLIDTPVLNAFMDGRIRNFFTSPNFSPFVLASSLTLIGSS